MPPRRGLKSLRLPHEHLGEPPTPESALAALGQDQAAAHPSLAQTASSRLTVTGAFFRHRGPRVTFHQERPPAPAEPTRQPAQVALMLALAHHLQRAVEGGAVANQAALAKAYGLTRARLTQVLDLLLLAPDLQARVLALEAVDGRQPLAERRLRRLVLCESWAEQRTQWSAIVGDSDGGPHGS